MRRVVPFLTFVLVAVGLYLALDGGLSAPRRPSGPATAPRAQDASTRPAPPESRPESAPSPILTEPYVETGPAAESAPASAPYREVVVIEVVREDDRPIAGAFVEARFGEVTLDGRTDAAGLAEIDAHAGVTATVQVWGATFCTAEQRLPLDSGRQRFVVPTGSKVAGRVVVAGATPEEPILLHLQGAVPGCSRVSATGELELATDEAGRFEFFNLAPAWSGTMFVPPEYKIVRNEDPESEDAPSPQALRLDAPNPALEIALEEQLSIKGRIVHPVTREPVPGVVIAKYFVEPSATVPFPGAWGSSQFRAESDGRFRVQVYRENTRVTLEVSDGARLGTRTIEVPGPFDAVRHVGEVELATVRQVRFRVRDSAGNPVAGAIGALSDTWSRSEPTDADGESAIRADERKKTLRVGKLGYATAEVSLPEDDAILLEIALGPGNQLIIDVKLADGSVPGHDVVVVHVSSAAPLFTAPHGLLDDILTRTGATESYSETVSDEENSLSLVPVPENQGRVILGGFRPGSQMTVELRGQRLGELLDEASVAIGAQDTKSLTLQARDMPQRFEGRVRTLDGDPIDGADVTISARGSRSTEGQTVIAASGEEGLFAFDGIFASSLDVAIVRKGFVTLRADDVPIPPPGAVRDFIMTASRDVTIILVDEAGEAVLDEAQISVFGPGIPTNEQPEIEDLGGGHHAINGLPPGPVDIEVTVGVAFAVVLHDSRNPIARIVIPNEGEVEIRWRRAPGDPEISRIGVESLWDGVFSAEIQVPAEVGEHLLTAKLSPGFYFATVEGYDPATGEWIALAYSPTFEIASRLSTSFEIPR